MITLQCCLFQTKPSSCRVRGGAGRPQTLKGGDRLTLSQTFVLPGQRTDRGRECGTHTCIKTVIVVL